MCEMASREAFDLHNHWCRRHFYHNFKHNWYVFWWWQLVISDTYHRVCSKKEK